MMGGGRKERFILPDGTDLEIIAFSPPAVPLAEEVRVGSGCGHGGTEIRYKAMLDPAASGAPVLCAPSACAACGGGLIYPVDWARSSRGAWNVRLRCPDCEAQCSVVLDREGVEHLNRTIFRDAQALARQARAVSRRNFEEEGAKLVRALALDLILPMDF
jgi:hypothetical protein